MTWPPDQPLGRLSGHTGSECKRGVPSSEKGKGQPASAMIYSLWTLLRAGNGWGPAVENAKLGQAGHTARSQNNRGLIHLTDWIPRDRK